MTDQRRAELRFELDALLTDASRSLAELMETVGAVRTIIWQLEGSQCPCGQRRADDAANDTTEPAAPADTE